MADDSVQPVPWVLKVSTVGEARQIGLFSLINNRSTVSTPGICPPLINRALHPFSCNFRAASKISASLLIFIPERYSVSGIFGVSSVALGNNSSMMVRMASSSNNLLPLVDIITGSKMIEVCWKEDKVSDTTFTASLLCSIPIFTASTMKSSRIASICPLKISGEIAWIPRTPCVF